MKVDVVNEETKRIIPNITLSELIIINSNDIEWYPDTMDGRDIVIDGNEDYFNEVLKLIGQK